MDMILGLFILAVCFGKLVRHLELDFKESNYFVVVIEVIGANYQIFILHLAFAMEVVVVAHQTMILYEMVDQIY